MTGQLDLDRRALLQRALLLVGAAALPGGSQALAATAKSGARLLSPARYALLTAVADTIIPKTDTPGAVDTGVPQQLDALLRNWAAPQRRTELVAALDAIDARARQAKQKAFAALAPNERHELLAVHDAAALQPPPPRQELAGNPLASGPSVADPNYGKLKQEPVQTRSRTDMPAVSDPGYSKLKELIVVLYYMSEAALTHELAYEHSPGEWRPSIPVTPDTRPYGGAGLI